MYTEKQHSQHRYGRWLQGLCAAAAALQMAWFAAAEAGLAQLPMSVATHGGILMAVTLVFGLLSQTTLELRVNAEGVSLRFFPYQWQFQRIKWNEVRQLRLLPPGEQPEGARFGLPRRGFTQAYWLTHSGHRVLHITLVNGTQIYVSTEHPRELLDFLQHGLYLKTSFPNANTR